MAQSLHVQILAATTIAVCLLLLGTAVLLWQNARGITHAWGIDVPVTVYLRDAVSDGEAEELAARLRALPQAARVEVVHPVLALERLRDGLGGQQGLLEGIEPDTLPRSIEVVLRSDVDPAVGLVIAQELEPHPAVDEVAVAGAWAAQASDFLATLRSLAVGLGVLVSVACIAIVGSTIRLGIFARRAEIQILRLVGGTDAFVRGPFLVEGMLQGAAGAAAALGLLQLGFDLVRDRLEAGLSLVFAAGAIRGFTASEWVAGLVFGALLGALGSSGAVARYEGV
jgi:cell division transport system permease protein